MSTPASEVGAAVAQPAAPTTSAAPAAVTSPAPATTAGLLGQLFSSINPLSNTSEPFLPNALLVVIGAVLAVGALLISQKQTVIQVASTAAEVAG
jgi:hypothetical protein